jgi:Glycosyl transferases group 1
MNILLIGNAGRHHAGTNHYLYNTRIYNGLVRGGHNVYFFSDTDEFRDLSPLSIGLIGKYRVNQKLLTLVKNFRPDVILMVQSNLIDDETFRIIKRQNMDIRIGRISIGALYSPQNIKNLKLYSSVIDASFVTTAGRALEEFSDKDQPFYFIPNITDSGIDGGRAFDLPSPEHDVSCFMNNNSPWDDRTRLHIANGLSNALPDLKTFYRGFNDQPGLFGAHYVEALQNSAMALSLSRFIIGNMVSTPETRNLYSSDRLAHILGNGVLALIPDQFGLDDLYSKDEVVFFDDVEDLAEKVSYYKAAPKARMTIAKKGWQKAHNEFNEIVVMNYVIERLMEKPLSREYAWPTKAW